MISVTVFACVQACHTLCNITNQQSVFTGHTSTNLKQFFSINYSWIPGTDEHAMLKVFTELLKVPPNSGIRRCFTWQHHWLVNNSIFHMLEICRCNYNVQDNELVYN